MPAAARQGDAGVPHCSSYVIATGSENVSINGRNAARVTDLSTSHSVPARRCFLHTVPIITGSSSVFINGLPAATVGSRLKSCTSVAQGSPDVIIGL